RCRRCQPAHHADCAGHGLVLPDELLRAGARVATPLLLAEGRERRVKLILGVENVRGQGALGLELHVDCLPRRSEARIGRVAIEVTRPELPICAEPLALEDAPRSACTNCDAILKMK